MAERNTAEQGATLPDQPQDDTVLAAVHDHLVHRDIKPANIFLAREDDTNDVVKLLDFGVAKALSDAAEELTGAGKIIGTPAYIAPEMMLGDGDRQDPRQDLYAVGMVLFQMITGTLPWPSSDRHAILTALNAGEAPRSLREVAPDCDPFLADVVDRALAREPDERFQTAIAFRAALRTLGEFTPGSLFAETYQIERKLGEGGMSAVYLAYDTRMERRCALKALLIGEEDDPDGIIRERFRRDGALARKIRHPGVVDVYASAVWQGRPFIVTEFIDGKTLREHWQDMDWVAFVEIVRQVASAVDAVHGAGIVHRDITPENILVDVRGAAKLVDFGLARRHGSELTGINSGQFLGRYGYTAPEQAFEPSSVGVEADQWSLAAIVYEALTGLTPFRDEQDHEVSGAAERYTERLLELAHPTDVRERNPSVSVELASVVIRALAHEAEERFPTASAFAESLAAAPAEGARLRVLRVPVGAISAGPAPGPAPEAQQALSVEADMAPSAQVTGPLRQIRWTRAAAIIAAVGVAGGAALMLVQGSRKSGASPAPGRPPAAAASQAMPGLADAGPVMMRVDSDPPGGTLRVHDTVRALPASLDEGAGTRLRAVVEKPGYEAHAVELVFSETGIAIVVLKELSPAQDAPRAQKKRAGGDEFDWGKQIYVRPGDDLAK